MRQITSLETQLISAGFLNLSDIATLRNVATINATQILAAGSSAAIAYYVSENPYFAAASSVIGYVAGYGVFTNVIMPFYERKDAEIYR